MDVGTVGLADCFYDSCDPHLLSQIIILTLFMEGLFKKCP
jgi:hypothetical protein